MHVCCELKDLESVSSYYHKHKVLPLYIENYMRENERLQIWKVYKS